VAPGGRTVGVNITSVHSPLD